MNAGAAGIFEKNDEGTWINTRNIVASDEVLGIAGINVDVFGDILSLAHILKMKTSFLMIRSKHRWYLYLSKNRN